MIKIPVVEKEICTGCSACAKACPTNAIKMKFNEGGGIEGFWYPVLDKSLCIQCGACQKVCHRTDNSYTQNILKKRKEEVKIKAAYSKNNKIMEKSSSGGIFPELARYIINQGGVVYGAAQESIFKVCHRRADSMDKIAALCKSKYLESFIGDTYIEAKADLEVGKLVLFTGTPCQIGGLLTFLGKGYENLYTCEVICHGVPSLFVYVKYIREIENRYHSRVKKVDFRDQSFGWNPNYLSCYFTNGLKISQISTEHVLHGGYLLNLFNRACCNECAYANLVRISDIALGDYFYCDKRLAIRNKNKGVSLVVLSTEKGEKLFHAIREHIYEEPVDKRTAIKRKKYLTEKPIAHKKRNQFLREIKRLPLALLKIKYKW